MKFLKKYNTYNDFKYDLINNDKILCAYIADMDNILISNEQTKFLIQYEINENLINTAQQMNTKIPLLTRCDLFKSIAIDGINIDLSAKKRKPYIFQTQNINDIGFELSNLIFPNGHFNEEYVLLTDLQPKKGVIQVELFDNIPPQSYIGLFALSWPLVSIDNNFFAKICTNNISYMFFYCTNLQTINLSKLNMQNIQYSDYLFYNCIHLSNTLIHFNECKELISYKHMFDNCYSLKL